MSDDGFMFWMIAVPLGIAMWCMVMATVVVCVGFCWKYISALKRR